MFTTCVWIYLSDLFHAKISQRFSRCLVGSTIFVSIFNDFCCGVPARACHIFLFELLGATCSFPWTCAVDGRKKTDIQRYPDLLLVILTRTGTNYARHHTRSFYTLSLRQRYPISLDNAVPADRQRQASSFYFSQSRLLVRPISVHVMHVQRRRYCHYLTCRAAYRD